MTNRHRSYLKEYPRAEAGTLLIIITKNKKNSFRL